MSNQPGRDPRAPKRNVSAYLLYQNAMREEFKAANPGMSFGRLAKYTSAMYTALPPAERETWEQRALADRARYRHELANYEYGIAYSKFRARAAKAPIGTRFMTMGLPIILKNATHAFRPKGNCYDQLKGLEPHDAIYRILIHYRELFAETLIHRTKQKRQSVGKRSRGDRG